MPGSGSDFMVLASHCIRNSFTAELLSNVFIKVTYSTLAGNRPKDFGNAVAVWQGTSIPWGHTPLIAVPIDKNTPDGDMIVDLSGLGDLQPPYTVAFGTGGAPTAFCASVVLSPAAGPPSMLGIDLSNPVVGTDSIFVSFSSLPGNDPAANKNWIGLWAGQGVTFDGSNMIGKWPVDSTEAKGGVAINGLEVQFNTYYTLAYACGPKVTDLAATLTFKTQPYFMHLLRSLFDPLGLRAARRK